MASHIPRLEGKSPSGNFIRQSGTVSSVSEILRYTFRIRPGVRAEAALIAEWHRCRWLWNEAVHLEKVGRKLTFFDLCKKLTEARSRLPWLRAGASMPQQQVLRSYCIALRQCATSRRGKPRVKPKNASRPSLQYTQEGISIKEGRLHLQGKIAIPVVWSRQLPSRPSNARIYRDTLGHWYVAFVVRRESSALPKSVATIGIDWGVATIATATDAAYDLPHRGHRKRCAAEMARLQRRMSRRRRPRGQVPSRGYQQARLQAARLHKKAARRTQHGARIWAKSVVDSHGLIAVEDFKPAFLAKSTMAKKAADAAIGAAKRELIERAIRAGREVVLVPPAYTTMTCAECGSRAKNRLDLGERVFRCEFCGHTADRDRNAARAILATAERNRVDVEGMRHVSALRGAAYVRPES